MTSNGIIDPSYLAAIKERGSKSRVYKKYQLTGLLIARLLGDERHKSLYIKLAKNHDEGRLLSLARDTAERRVRNKGAYFMSIVSRAGMQKEKTKKKRISIQQKLRMRKKIRVKTLSS